MSRTRVRVVRGDGKLLLGEPSRVEMGTPPTGYRETIRYTVYPENGQLSSVEVWVFDKKPTLTIEEAAIEFVKDTYRRGLLPISLAGKILHEVVQRKLAESD